MAVARLSVPGFRASGVRCGIKAKGTDLALIASDEPAAWAGVFTQSSVVGAPVEWSRARVRAGFGRGVVINSGISNVACGAEGRRNTREMAQLAAREIGCRAGEICVASTGVIGEPLPMECLRSGIPSAASALAAAGWSGAADAIRTTDTFAKTATVRAKVGGRGIRVLGIAKGSGMIEPRMATMLAFLVTDALVSPAQLRRVLRRTSDISFNRVTVDGETSTSDMALLLASGQAGNVRIASDRDPGAAQFEEAIAKVATSLARDLARDGEGATKLVDVEVRGARNRAEAEIAVRRIANSMLVKTAIHGGDPNWGRILQTVGAAGVAVRLARAEVRVGPARVFSMGEPVRGAALRRAEKHLQGREVRLSVDLGAGQAADRIWTCDLSRDYIRINADYTT
ncbi:MAG: bifunctional glutamate N-acetyltransferase/amino-acid acetyltransferase ArgJ [Myxococcota bacterium]|nr:bifunctional glutamate N-acetyltransferase/amino-acid acetyltransferase ArgJ [Myxococcota bacterium]